MSISSRDESPLFPARPPALTVGPDAGLRVGDILRGVDGRNAADLSHAEITAILSRAGITWTVTVERQGTMKNGDTSTQTTTLTSAVLSACATRCG
jgi:C-terminal processing protease CtpA/Prc